MKPRSTRGGLALLPAPIQVVPLYRTKSGKPRGIPINTAVYDALIALEPDSKQRLGRLLKKATGAGWDRIRTAFELALPRAKIQDFTFHDLRYAFASHAVMRGVCLAELKEELGHSTQTMTLRCPACGRPTFGGRRSTRRLDLSPHRRVLGT